jgi:asparagine N-glycosylation enzyme membrane subunit Stt3
MKHTKLIFVCLLLVFIVYAIIAIIKVEQIQWFYSYDPFYHYHITLYNEFNHPFSTGVVGVDGKPFSYDYPTLFRPLTAAFSAVSGISLLQIYKLSGIFFRILAGLYVFLIVRRITKKEWFALIATTAFLFTPYMFYRSLISYPENMVLVFHLMIMYELVKALRTKRLSVVLFVAIGISLLIHYRSIIVPAVAIALVFIMIAFEKIKDKNLLTLFKQLIMGGCITLIISAPVIANVIKQYKSYANENIGSNATLAQQFKDMSQYAPLTYDEYQEQIGSVILAFVLLSLVILMIYIIRNNHRDISIFFLLMTLFTFALTRGQQLKLYIPPVRMFSYFTIFAIPSIALALLSIEKRITSTMKTSLVIIVILILSLQAYHTKGWVGLDNKDIALGYRLNALMPENSVIVWDKISPFNLGVNRYDLVEPDWLNNQATLDINKENTLKERLSKLYPNKNVIIITDNKLPGFNLIQSSTRLNAYILKPSHG